ncbi:MAG TPA: PQQ-binding-like beta-propeller repeat protein, partial [Pirellulaceae bacterium]
EEWPEEGPPLDWVYRDAGLGYSGPAIVGDRIYLMGARKRKEYLLALDAASGKPLWSTEMGDRYENNWGNGPRGTPTVDGDLVYGLSGYGDLVCAKCTSGEVVWQIALEDFGGKLPVWGFAESVLVDGNRVIVTPGGDRGAILALDKRTGKPLWQSEEITEPAHYSSAVPFTLNGKRQIAQLFPEQLVGVDADSGKVLWSVPWEGRIAVIPSPVVSGNKIYVTSGYGVGCMLVVLETSEGSDRIQPREAYRNKLMKNHHGGVLLHDGHLFGYSDGVGWLCQDLESGDEVWNERGALGKGAVTCADGKLYCIDETTGKVMLVDATTTGWTPRGEFTLTPQTTHRKPDGRIWTHPVVSQGKLYLRDQELFYCFDVTASP